MSSSTNIQDYYDDPKKYLADHQDFFQASDLAADLDFLIKAAGIKQDDRVLDIACGQGRHATELAKRGYQVDGVDFSAELIGRARQTAADQQLPISYYVQNIEALSLPNKYDVIYWFFSDFAEIDLPKVISGIKQSLKSGGRLLIDGDNHFRLKKYLDQHPDSPLKFDASQKRLIDSEQGVTVPYPDLDDWRQMLANQNTQLDEVYGDYDLSAYSDASPRLIVIGTKQ